MIGEQRFLKMTVGNFIVVTIWNENLLMITVPVKGFWHLEVEQAELSVLAQNVKMSTNDYLLNFFASVESQYIQPEFSITREGNCLQLMWRKEVKSGLKLPFGDFTLTPSSDQNHSFDELTTCFVSHISGLKSEISKLTSEIDSVRRIADTALNKYEQLVLELGRRESILLSKFVAVLNEKKRRIAALEDKGEFSESYDKPLWVEVKSEETGESLFPDVVNVQRRYKRMLRK